MITKECRVCKEVKPLDQFNRDKKNKDGKSWRCKDCHRAHTKAYREANPDVLKRWRAENPDRVKARRREWTKNHPEKSREYENRRRSKKKTTVVDDAVTHSALKERYGILCMYCGEEMEFTVCKEYNPRKATLDHIVPIDSGGDHTFDNAVLCCLECNITKNNKSLLKFLLDRKA